MIRGLLALLFLFLAACAHEPRPHVVEPVEVLVPVETPRTPPAELLEPVEPGEELVFVDPADPAASSALSEAGERALRKLLRELNARVRAWEAWAVE